MNARRVGYKRRIVRHLVGKRTRHQDVGSSWVEKFVMSTAPGTVEGGQDEGGGGGSFDSASLGAVRASEEEGADMYEGRNEGEGK